MNRSTLYEVLLSPSVPDNGAPEVFNRTTGPPLQRGTQPRVEPAVHAYHHARSGLLHQIHDLPSLIQGRARRLLHQQRHPRAYDLRGDPRGDRYRRDRDAPVRPLPTQHVLQIRVHPGESVSLGHRLRVLFAEITQSREFHLPRVLGYVPSQRRQMIPLAMVARAQQDEFQHVSSSGCSPRFT